MKLGYLGYDSGCLSSLPEGLRALLIRQNYAAIAVFLISALAIGFITTIATHSLLIGICATLIPFSALVVIHIHITTSTGIDLNHAPDQRSLWRPRWFRVCFYFLISLFLSQPILLAGYSLAFSQKAYQLVEDRARLSDEARKVAKERQAAVIRSEISVQEEFLQRVRSGNGQAVKPDGERKIHSLNRKALVFGNQSYPASPLNNPKKDASDIATTLTDMGFSVTSVVDATELEMASQIDKYLRSLQAGDISFFYFSGHGFQANGSNYLVPVDFTGASRLQAVALNGVIDAISSRKVAASIIVVDACRDFSFGKDGGLALTEAGINTYLAFAAKPGQSAIDGESGSNGVFTGSLLKYLKEPVDVDTVFRKTRVEVATQTQNAQETWSAHSLTNGIVLPSVDSLAMRMATDQVAGMRIRAQSDLATCEGRAGMMQPAAAKKFLPQCIEARIRQLEDDELELSLDEASTGSNLGELANSATKLMLMYRTMGLEGLSILSASLLLTLILALPFLWRDFFVEALRHYELKKLGVAQSCVLHGYEDVQRKLGKIEGIDSWLAYLLPPLRFEPQKDVLDPRESNELTLKGDEAFNQFRATILNKGQAEAC